MRLGRSAIALAWSTAIACPAAAQDRPGLAASTPWTIDYDTDSCALIRRFGEGEDQAYIELRRFEPGLGLQTVIASKRMTARRMARFDYRFGSDGKWRGAGSAFSVSLPEGFSGVIFEPDLVDLPELEDLDDPAEREAYFRSIDWRAMEQEAATRTDQIALRGAFPRNLTLQLGPLDKPIAALNQCIDELITHWGIDVEAHKTLTRAPVPIDLSDSSSMIDYPPMMVRRSMPGLVNIRLAIDATGRVTGCHIQMPLSDPVFEESSCADIQHAFEFEPALDKDGKPIASYYVTEVHFRLD